MTYGIMRQYGNRTVISKSIQLAKKLLSKKEGYLTYTTLGYPHEWR